MKIKNYNIFYTDDDSDDKEIFKEIINELHPDFSIEFQSDGSELLDRLKEIDYKPDIVFLDINMPFVDGFQVLSELRQSLANKDFPVVILSTSNDTDAIAKAKNAGATFYVCKPNSYTKFKDILAELLGFNWANDIQSQHFKDFVYA
ncbi:response regulator [Emticicia sp. BO119]|uniref:response regulator n=1 Tax=Emticicia sp. BO119 TaxID=2757768 RepID=UPI0015F0B4A8|nr:response regulator [Emticicia sp. BO119]MBA4853848.1 response regulator [Emticicia sp. BO119]